MKISKAFLRIGIDARFVGPQGTGLGKYTEKLIESLQKIDSKNSYAIFLKQTNWDHLKLQNKNFKKTLADISWYSLEEQLKMAGIYNEQNLDLLHVPHFNVPILYRKKFIVTIHDLIHHDFSQESATTKNPLIYKLKRGAYKCTIKNAVKKSQKIIVPSRFVKGQLLKKFGVDGSKIKVISEAAEEEYFNRQPSTINHQPFFLYVGNAYPHKNLNNLLNAFKILTTNYQLPTTKLILVCPRDIFWLRLQKEIKSRNLGKTVEVKGYLDSTELSKLFQKAQAYVFPSLSEGFGIPGLNAMAAGIPVIASNIPTLKEVYQNAALYFDPKNPKDIAEKIKKVIKSTKISHELTRKGQIQVKKYSWQKMAKETLSVYENN